MSALTYSVRTATGAFTIDEESPWYAAEAAEDAVEDVRLVKVDGRDVDTTIEYDRAVRAEAYEDEDTAVAIFEVPEKAVERFKALTESPAAIVDNDGIVYTIDDAGVAAQRFEFVRVIGDTEDDTELRVDFDQPISAKTYIATLREVVEAANGSKGATIDDILDRGWDL